MDVILFEIPDLSFFKQAREAAAAIQGKMVDMQLIAWVLSDALESWRLVYPSNVIMDHMDRIEVELNCGVLGGEGDISLEHHMDHFKSPIGVGSSDLEGSSSSCQNFMSNTSEPLKSLTASTSKNINQLERHKNHKNASNGLIKFKRSGALLSVGASLRKLDEQPGWLKGGQLRDYQLEGLNFLVNRTAGEMILMLFWLMKMGLGKTVQSVSMLGFLQNAQQIYGPFLVVVPLSTLSNWAKEFKKWLPDMNVIVYVGTRASREGQLAHLSWVLMWFEVIFGLRINLDKSEILPIGRVENLEELALELGCKVGKLPSLYLGLPLGVPHKSVVVWDGVE
ncbi:Protein chromatin remodeling 5 [Vitis vinifera]|uniref:Protein chromatin remodeling 5 n=1 Tax=Vitis vinifera TaxID=29760 RepID=A0A438KGI4_VITVI|nr:Protein chromatin remodeling 5 [Vitis vinifera]